MINLTEAAEILDEAQRNAMAVPQYSARVPLTPDDAYQVQALSMQRRYDRGERRVGVKMGLTSQAKMA